MEDIPVPIGHHPQRVIEKLRADLRARGYAYAKYRTAPMHHLLVLDLQVDAAAVIDDVDKVVAQRQQVGMWRQLGTDRITQVPRPGSAHNPEQVPGCLVVTVELQLLHTRVVQ